MIGGLRQEEVNNGEDPLFKRFGQARRTVDMLNLDYAKTPNEKVYSVLSRRLKDNFDIFGSLPDTIDDEWKYIEKRAAAKSAFEIRYQSAGTVTPAIERWELCSKVLAKTELLERLSGVLRHFPLGT